MIPITHIWLSTTPMDMRCGSGKLLTHILTEHQSIRPHCAYLFYNKAGTRLKVFIHDGLGVWLCSRQLDDNKFHGLTKPLTTTQTGISINREQFNALISGLPWRNMGKDKLTPIL